MSTKLYAVIWHWIESDGLTGVFSSLEKARLEKQKVLDASDRSTGVSIHEIEIDRAYDEGMEEIE